MAKKKNIDTHTSKKQTLARVTRTEAYAENVRVLFAKAVNEILALNKQLPTLSDGEMFSFDAQSQKMQTKVENVLRKLHAAATLAIKQGVKLEWDQANEEVDKLLSSVMGKRVMTDDRFNALTGRNTAAMNAFLDRSEKGMKLSDRVWKPVRQLRDEMEVALTISIGEGESAANMSRKVREYLNDPDLMFRRFRYKAGEEKILDEDGNEIGTKIIWGRKWKKRVRDANGKVHFIDYDKDSYKDEYTGKGYYKSSAQNAMRVTRTETNIAYRRADHARWNDLDFVLGVRVQTSKSHKKSKHGDEICEKLAGDYPKDFVFDGWHPQCFCYATPILMDESEMQKYADAIAEGKQYTPKGQKITDYPQGFKDWCKDNESKLLDAHDNGRDPYFVRNNYSVVERVLNGDDFNEAPKMSPLEIAQQRHENRTPEQVQEIQNKVKERQKAITAANKYISDFEDFNDVDTSALQDAYKHADWQKVKQEALALAQKKRQIIESAISLKNELAGIKDVDTDAAENALKSDKLTSVQMEVNSLEKVKQQLGTLTYLDDPVSAAKASSLADAVVVNAAVKDKIENKWGHLSLQEQQKKLKFEIYDYLGSSTDKYGAQAKYPNTWKISQAAYMKQLEKVNDLIDWEQIDSDTKLLAAFKTKSQIYNADLANLYSAIAVKNKTQANALLNKLKIKKNDLEKAQAKRNLKNAKGAVCEEDGIRFGQGLPVKELPKDSYTQARKDAAVWCKSQEESEKKFEAEQRKYFDNASYEEIDAQYSYTAGSGYINRPLRGYDREWEKKCFKGLGNVSLNNERSVGSKHIKNLTAFIDRTSSTQDIWLQRGIDNKGLEGFLGVSLEESKVKALVGSVVIDTAFSSCGSAKGTGFSGNILNIYCPKGTKMLYLQGHSAFDDCNENETLIQRNTHYRITKVEYSGWRYFIDIEVVAQM